MYPGEGEVVASSRLRFLIEAPNRRVEIAVDGEGWRACRRGDGYWWLDAALEPGRHQAFLRCEGPRGGAESVRVCRFLVSAEQPRADLKRTARGALHAEG